MRGKLAIAACVGLALLAGCNTLDRNYLREGAGADVPTADIVAATNLQQLYFGEVCRQAGLPVRPTPDGILLCDELAMPPAAWTLFVQAGMNDIDRRCDAYLVWLDDRRRWREPFLKQLHSTAAATAAIMGLSGVGAVPIAIVGTAFGFAQETFVNLSGRLITEIDHSTVQTVVLTRQNGYRAGLRNTAIPNGPAALYALRSYLRLCMPMTIETEINATISSIDRTGRAPVPLVTPATIAGGIITDVDAPIQRVPKRRETANPNRLTDFERSLDSVAIRRIQNALCVPPTGDLGPSGSATRNAIRDYLDGRETTPSEVLTPNTAASVDEAVAAVPNCTAALFANGFEVAFYGVPKNGREDRIKSFQRKLNAALTKAKVNTQVDVSGRFDASTRAGIAAYRNAVQRPLAGLRNQQIDRTLNDDIFGQ